MSHLIKKKTSHLSRKGHWCRISKGRKKSEAFKNRSPYPRWLWF